MTKWVRTWVAAVQWLSADAWATLLDAWADNKEEAMAALAAELMAARKKGQNDDNQ